MKPKSPEWLAHKAELARARRAKKKAATRPLAEDVVAKQVEQACKKVGAQFRRNVENLTGKFVPDLTPMVPKPKRVTTAEVNADIAAMGLLARPVASAPGSGGPRKNSGPKPKYNGETMGVVSFRATAAQHEEFRAAGGNAWLRDVLDKRLAAKAKKGGA